MERETVDTKHLRRIDGRIHITARLLCARFKIRPDLFDQALQTIEIETGQVALLEDFDCWIDSALFYDLSISPELTAIFFEERQQAILHLLGHFDARPGVSVTKKRSAA